MCRKGALFPLTYYWEQTDDGDGGGNAHALSFANLHLNKKKTEMTAAAE